MLRYKQALCVDRGFFVYKHYFYNELHDHIAQELNIDPSLVSFCRYFSGAGKVSRLDVIQKAVEIQSKPKKKRNRSKAHYQNIINFIASCSEDTWKSVTRPVEVGELL